MGSRQILVPYGVRPDHRDRVGWSKFIKVNPAEIAYCRWVERPDWGERRLEILIRGGTRLQFDANLLDLAYTNTEGETLTSWLVRHYPARLT